jgi:osmotically-inducible protein OsmY
MLVAGCGKTIAPQSKPATDDLSITTRVKTALLNDPEIAGKIDVATANGVVTLSGTVKSPTERDKAVAVARKVSGVTDVKSALQVQ